MIIELFLAVFFPQPPIFYVPVKHLPVIEDRVDTIPSLISRYTAVHGVSGASQKLIAIAYCESKYNPYAANPSSSAKGIFQILDGTWRVYGCTGDVYNNHDNIDCAIKIYKRSGFSPWAECL